MNVKCGVDSFDAVMRPMKGGDDPFSYNKQSNIQGAVFEHAKPTLQSALELVSLPEPTEVGIHSRSPLIRVADLGCATGRNSIALTSFVISALKSRASPRTEFFAYFSDLPGTDFNSLFDLLFHSPSKSLNPGTAGLYTGVVPGSFYGRLFPPSYLHVATCSIALHWLSQDPCPFVSDSLGDKLGAAIYKLGAAKEKLGAVKVQNPGTCWCKNSTSPGVGAAYKAQAHSDLIRFLTNRAVEIAPGGMLWILLPIAGDEFAHVDGNGKLVGRWWVDLLDDSWMGLVKDGVLPASTIDNFNLPAYYRTIEEVREGVEALGDQWSIVVLETLEEPVPQPIAEEDEATWQETGTGLVGVVRSVVEPMIVASQGVEVAEKLAQRMTEIAPSLLRKHHNSADFRLRKLHACVALLRL